MSNQDPNKDGPNKYAGLRYFFTSNPVGKNKQTNKKYMYSGICSKVHSKCAW